METNKRLLLFIVIWFVYEFMIEDDVPDYLSMMPDM